MPGHSYDAIKKPPCHLLTPLPQQSFLRFPFCWKGAVGKQMWPVLLQDIVAAAFSVTLVKGTGRKEPVVPVLPATWWQMQLIPNTNKKVTKWVRVGCPLKGLQPEDCIFLSLVTSLETNKFDRWIIWRCLVCRFLKTILKDEIFKSWRRGIQPNWPLLPLFKASVLALTAEVQKTGRFKKLRNVTFFTIKFWIFQHEVFSSGMKRNSYFYSLRNK